MYFEDDKLKKTKSYTDYDKGHGRIETRECTVVNDVEWLKEIHPKWQTIKSIIMINAKREIKTTVSSGSRYYISSLDISAEKILHAIRNH